MPNENISLVRIEERTRSLESNDKKHFFIEMVLFIAILVLALFLVSGCSINTPEPSIPEETKKEWKYEAKVEKEGLEFSLIEDGKAISVLYNKGEAGIIREGDSISIPALRMNLRGEFTNDVITIFSGSTIIGIFTLS